MDSLKGRDFLRPDDLSPAEVAYLIDKARGLKEDLAAGKKQEYLAGKAVALIFEKPSTRTRVSLEVGVAQLGGHPLVLDANTLQLSRGETLADMGRVLARYVDAVVLRTFGQDRLEELAAAASVPVINGLSNEFHPCQILADLLTIVEKKGRFRGVKLAYVGDGNNVARTLMIGGAQVGMDVAVATPPGREPEPAVVGAARRSAGRQSEIVVGNNARRLCQGADVIYTDVWVSMGDSVSREDRSTFEDYQVNQDLLSVAHGKCLVMHCLPAHRGQEITDDVIDGEQSVVLDQAENRLHAQKALLASLL
ncbi:MAG: ornithine carbamoyltransferase [Terriglobia bacterium]